MWPVVPSGAISVMPHAWTMVRPRCWNAAIIERGTAEPPTTIARMLERSKLPRVGVEILQHAHPDRRHAAGDRDRSRVKQIDDAGGSRCGPGITIFAPTIVAPNGMPQALAWNIGTTGIIVSRFAEPMQSTCAGRGCAAPARGASTARPLGCRWSRWCSTSRPARLSVVGDRNSHARRGRRSALVFEIPAGPAPPLPRRRRCASALSTLRFTCSQSGSSSRRRGRRGRRRG